MPHPDTSDHDMLDLIRELNDPDTGEAEAAQAGLHQYGAAMVDPLVKAIPSLGDFGILCAVELLEEFGDERAGPVLIPLLSHANPTVREWVASALGVLGIRQAVPALIEAYESVKRRRTPPHWTEPVAIREALTQLGARQEVIPPAVRALRAHDALAAPCWRIGDIGRVIDALADANQATISAGLWTHSGCRYSFAPTPPWEPDWSLPWADLVEQTRRESKEAVIRTRVSTDSVVTLTWMNEQDL